LQAIDKFGSNGRNAILGCGWKSRFRLCMRVAEDDPEAGTINVAVAGADSAGQLRDFQAGMAEHFGKNAAGVVDKVAETLRDKDDVDIARSGLLDLLKVVIGEGPFERNFDGGGRLVLVRRKSDGHGEYGCTPPRSFRVGAAGENGEGAVELLGEHDTGELVRERHCAKRELLAGTLAESFGKAVGVAAEENELACAAIAVLGEPFGQSVRIEILSGGVEKDDGGGAVSLQAFDRGSFVADFIDFDGQVAANALDVVVEDGAQLGAAGFAEHEKTEFHESFVLAEERSRVALLLGMIILAGFT
jgi:hypothetical protein